ncbi:phage tail protein [Paractinoplanes durhamensis]|uniref:Phage tail protein n=1 Tax=Paractinoplanes durhamensis TaxID=113563 RepID=A0ABQ3YTC3_9ACTN|nr:phage tail protein [Actinoplanes durhamensis]GIE00860.1 phage tail protein [Actinoplanes durhamensis]
MTTRDGWLVEQLPRVMATDPVLRDFVTAFEQTHDTVRERIDAIEFQMDTGLASPEMLSYLGSWLGVMLEPTDPAEYRRSLVREVGKLLGWRGTRYGVEALLQAATGARVTVIDAGGIFGRNDKVPAPDPVVVVQMDHTGHLTERQVMAFLQSELPLGSKIQLDVRFQPQPARGRARPPGSGDDNA